MNKIYKVIWSKVRNCYVAVSEIAKRNGKSCTSVNCGGKANRSRGLRMAAVTLGVTAALVGGVGFGTPAAWAAASSGNSVTVTTDAYSVYGGCARSGDSPSGSIICGGYSTTVTDAADSNTVTIGGVNVNNRVFGGYSAGGNANLNNLTINSGATIGEQVFGGNSGDYGNGNADQNKVTINGGQFDAEVNGGYSLKGNARDNQVIINGGTLKSAESVYGGQVGTGNATGNIVNISQSSTEVLTTINGTVYGGYSYSGNAGGTTKEEKGNKVSISGGTLSNNVYGGYAFDGTATASYNSVEISNGTLSRDVYGGFVYGGTGTAGYNNVKISGGTVRQVYGGQAAGTGNATGNIVNISQSSTEVLTTINGFVYGGSSYNGNVSLNEVTFTGGSVKGISGGHISDNNSSGVVSGNKVTLDGSDAVVIQESYSSGVCGGYNWGTGAATGNQVEIKNGATVNNTVYGGYTYSGAAGGTTKEEGNKVIISSGTVTKGVYGGYAYGSGSATGNKVDISQTGTAVLTTISGSVYGGYSANGNAGGTGEGEGNKVTISDGKVTQSVYGGYVNGGTGTAGYNSVEITGGNLNNAYGGYINSGTGKAEGNKVSISGTETTTSISGTVYGGRASGGNATSNRVDISGGTVGSSVYGGYSYTGTAEGNTVNVTGGHMKSIYGAETSGDSTGNNGAVIKNIVSVSGSGTQIDGTIYGGSSIWGKVDGNKVTISNGTLNYVMGGRSSNGDVVNNEVTVTGGTLSDVYGGFSRGTTENSKAEGNKVIISGPETTVNSVYGGWSNRNALNNSVTISGGTVNSSIYGGNASDGSASNNTVTITGNATIKSSILGGLVRSDGSGDATGNTVTISGSPNFMFEGSSGIWGGRTMGSGAAKNNTVNILSSIAVGFLIGGQSIKDPSNVSGNTLNVAAKNVTVGQDNVRGFQNMNFYLPANIAKDDTMLTVNSGNATDVTGVTFGVAALSGVNLQKGDTVNLLVNSDGLTTDDTLKTTDSATLAKASFLSANSLTTDDKYELSISKKGENTIIATVDNVTEQSADAGGDTSGDANSTTSAVEEIKKSPVETRMGVVTMVNAGADLLAGQGMSNAADAAAAERSGGDGVAAARAGGFAPFAAVGLGNLRAKSGSHVDTKSIGLSLGFAREIENKSGKLLVGPVVEYGHGKYDSYQDNGITADGKSSYWGIGVIAKQTNHNGFYYEGSLRAGRTKSDYGSDSARPGNHVSYDSSATYWAAHLGAGKLFDMGHDNTLDVYGKYFYSHTGSDSTTIHIGAASEGVDFSAVNSHRLCIGTRLTHALNAKNKIYGGLAWQYEFNGDARAVYSVSGEAPSPSVKGSSGMLELGWQVKPGKSPMTIDLGVTGWVGKQRGITANVQMNWTF